MTDEQARQLYCKAFPNSPQAEDPEGHASDWGDIVAEMRGVVEAKTLNDAMDVIEWWWWGSVEEHRKAAQRVRKLAKRYA